MKTLFAVCAAFVLTPSALSQSTWIVDPGGAGNFTTIQAAIDAPATLDGDTILVLPGTYVEHVDFAGKTLVVKADQGPSVTAIDAGGSGSAVTVASGEGPGTTLEGFTVSGGTGTRHPALFSEVGGGVYCSGSSLSLRDCVLMGNGGFCETHSGGGLYAEAATVMLQGCIVASNSVATFGGGVSLESCSSTIDDCRFLQNLACYGAGGGLYVRGGSLLVRDSRFDGNLTPEDSGGGISLDGCTATLRRCTLIANVTDNDHPGGGLFGYGADVDVFRSTFARNFASHGGGASFEGGTVNIARSTFADNEAHTFVFGFGRGGGLFGTPATNLSVRFTTFTHNRVIDESSGQAEGGAVWGPAVLENCTLFGNQGIGPGPVGGGAWGSTLENCIVRDNSPDNLAGAALATYSDVQGGWPGAGNIDQDPLFWNPAATDFRLIRGSPCIDAGNPSSPPDPDGSVADMGAFRFQASYCPEPLIYCSAKLNSCGSRPSIGSSGQASVTAGSGFVVNSINTRGQECGLLLYTTAGRASVPFSGGVLCLATPIKRSVRVCDATGSAGLCDGTLAIDLNAFAAGALGGHPLAALSVLGTLVDCQFIGRDAAGTSLSSDALEYSVCP